MRRILGDLSAHSARLPNENRPISQSSQSSQPNTFRNNPHHLRVAALALIMALPSCYAVSASAQYIIANPNFSPANGVGYGPLTGWTQNPNPSTLAGFPSLTGSNSFGQR